jgi:hypothetical protein
MAEQKENNVNAIKQEARDIRKRIIEIRVEKRKISHRLYEIQKICPHDEGYDFPSENKMNVISHGRNVCCKVCGAVVGKYCRESEDHICKYPVPFEEADYHETCTKCGKWLEDP